VNVNRNGTGAAEIKAAVVLKAKGGRRTVLHDAPENSHITIPVPESKRPGRVQMAILLKDVDVPPKDYRAIGPVREFDIFDVDVYGAGSLI